MTITFGREAAAEDTRPIPPKPQEPALAKKQPRSQAKSQPGTRQHSQEKGRMEIPLKLPIRPPFDQPSLGTGSKSIRLDPPGTGSKSPSGSGIGPERALEAIKPFSSRNSAKASSFPELPCERRTDPAEPHRPHTPGASPTTHLPKPPHSGTAYPKGQAPNHPAAAGSGRSEHWKRSNPSPRATARKPQSFPELPCERRTDPAEPATAHTPLAPAPQPTSPNHPTQGQPTPRDRP